MELKMMGGGGQMDFDSLTAVPGEVVEGKIFYGAGSEETQTGTVPDMGKMRDSPGYSSASPKIPLHAADSAAAVTDTDGTKRIALAPPKGAYPGDKGAYVGCKPSDLGITEGVIPVGKTVCGVSGSYGSDGTIAESDIKEGKIGYGASGRVIGSRKDYGAVTKTLAPGESYEIKKGMYDDGKIEAERLSGQTVGTAEEEDILSGKTAWVNGAKLTGTMENVQAVDPCKSATLSSGVLYARMTKGAHVNNATSGYPEVSVPQATLASAVGLTAAKLAKGQTVCGVSGSYTSDADAAAENILSGKTAYVNGSKVTGTMANQGAQTQELSAGGSYTIPEGYHNGSGKVTAKTLASQTDGTAEETDILSGETAWVGGTKVTGTMENVQAIDPCKSVTLSGSVLYVRMTKGAHVNNATSGYPEVSVPQATLASAVGLTAAKLAKGQTVCGVSGSYTSDADAAAENILSGKTAYVDGSKVTGTMTNRGAQTKELSAGGSYTIPKGYHNGSGKVTAKTLASQTSGTAEAAHILSGKTAWVGGAKVTGTMANCGKYQYAGGIGSGTDDDGEYYSLNAIPEGAYFSNGSSWAPEIRCLKSTLASGIGLTAAKLVSGQTVCGVTGTKKWTCSQIGANAYAGFKASSNDAGPYEESFTMPADGTVYYHGMSAVYGSSYTAYCQILKNGTVVDSRDIASGNYAVRGTMMKKSFSASKGDVIKVYAKVTGSTASMSCIYADCVYFA